MSNTIPAILLSIFLVTLPSVTVIQAQDNVDFPFLPEAQHIGTMFYGWGAPPPAHIEERIIEAVKAGMNGFTVYLDWNLLEPSAGEYDFVELDKTLTWANNHELSTFANITIIDIENLVMPAEFLADGDRAETQLADGIRLNDPVLINRFLLLLDELVPLMVDKGVFYLGVGNEIDGWLTENPDAIDDYKDFLKIVNAHVDDIAPDLAVGVTVTGGIPLYQPAFMKDLTQVVDVVSANIYGIDVSDFTVTETEETRALMNDFLDGFGDQPIVIPEFGCNSASSMNSSLELQADCYEVLLNIIQSRDDVRFATAFTFHDFDDDTCSLIQSAFGLEAENNNIYEQRVADYLCTLGLMSGDGSPKPAFRVFIDKLSQ